MVAEFERMSNMRELAYANTPLSSSFMYTMHVSVMRVDGESSLVLVSAGMGGCETSHEE